MKKALVIGGALSGYGAAKLLIQQDYDVYLVSRDDFEHRLELEDMGVHVILNDEETDIYDSFDLIIKNPGISNSHPLVQRFKHVLNEIEIAVMANPLGHYYAISGTNGKTTTVTLLYHMLKRKSETALLAGNVGISLSERIATIGNIEQDVALEIAAFQMEGTPNFKPEVYALLNLSSDHLDRFENEMDYYQAKLTVLQNNPLFLRNADDEMIMELTKDYKGPVLDVSLESYKDIYVLNKSVYFKEVKLFDIKDLKIKGKHNLMNAMFAAAMAYLAQVDIKDIQKEIKAFNGLEHRLEPLEKESGVLYINDSKATNPKSTLAAIEAFDQPLILIAGGLDENLSFDSLKEKEPVLKAVIVYGETKTKLKEIFPNAHVVSNLDEAMHIAVSKAKKGDIVLFSPACASYDQFNSYIERGEYFKKLVAQI